MGHASRLTAPDRPRLVEAAGRVVGLYQQWGQPEKAAAWKARLRMPDLPADVFAQPRRGPGTTPHPGR